MRVDCCFRPGFYQSRRGIRDREQDRLDGAPEYLRIPAREPFFVSGATHDLAGGVPWIVLTPLFADGLPRYVNQHPKGYHSDMFERLVDRVVVALVSAEPDRPVSEDVRAYLEAADLGAEPANRSPVSAEPSVFETALVHTSTLHPDFQTLPEDRVDRLGQTYCFESGPAGEASWGEACDQPVIGHRYRVVEQWWVPEPDQRINRSVYRLQDLADRDRLVLATLTGLQGYARRIG
ncbi:hypothetical protein GF314_00150 [bacterium]|nr:hypothetical protein [bacterium]